MPPAEMRETLEVLPRNVVLSVEYGSNSNRFYFSPAAEIMGNALRRSPRANRDILERTARYKSRHQELLREGRTYEPLFPWPDELLAMDPERLPEGVRSGIKEVEGVFTLYDIEPAMAVRKLIIKGNVLSAEVKSKGLPGGGRPNYYNCSGRSAFLDDAGMPALTAVSCNCGDQSYGLEKGGAPIVGFMSCIHNSAMRGEFYERMRAQSPRRDRTKRKGMVPGRPVFMPFNFVPNWAYQDRRLHPRDSNLAALEGDVLVTRYVLRGEDDDIYGINCRLFSIEETYSPVMLAGIREGVVKRRVIGQRRKKARMSRRRWAEENDIFMGLGAEIRSHGYEYDGMTTEFGRVARRFINEETGNSIGVVFTADEPPFYVVREPVPGSRPNPTGRYEGEMNPFMLVGKRGVTGLDDVTMKTSKMRIELPTVVRLPESGRGYNMPAISRDMRKTMRTVLRKAHGGPVTSIEKYARVHYAD